MVDDDGFSSNVLYSIKKKKTVAVTEGHVGRTGVTKSKTASRRSLIRAFGCLWCFRLWVDYYRYYYPKLV